MLITSKGSETYAIALSSSVVLCALRRRRALLHLGSNKLRIFRFALRSCAFELPTLQPSSSAIS